MFENGFVILFVDDVARSAAFYKDLLGQEPDAGSPNFSALPLGAGITLGLWSRHKATPAPAGAAGATEVAFVVSDADAVHTQWSAKGLHILQAPTTTDFGRTFVARDPDGHRLRVLTPAAA